MTDQPGPQQRIADTIRPAMLKGLQNASLDGPGGTRHINEWVDWIAEAVAVQVVQAIVAERDAFADRVDTLSHVAKRHKAGHQEAARELQQLTARVAGLEAELTRLRSASGVEAAGASPEPAVGAAEAAEVTEAAGNSSANCPRCPADLPYPWSCPGHPVS